MQYFDAKPLDQAAFYMTSLLPIMGIGMFFVILNLDDYRVEVEVPWLPFLPLVIAMCFWLYAWMESVKGYVVSTEGIEIKRTLLPSKKITWDYIYQVDIAHPDDFGLTYRKKRKRRRIWLLRLVSFEGSWKNGMVCDQSRGISLFALRTHS